jgi:hypothetical protein
MRGISWLAEDLLASQKELCSMELVSYQLMYLIKYHTDWHDTRHTHSFSTRSLQISTPHRLTQYTTHVTPTAPDLFRSAHRTAWHNTRHTSLLQHEISSDQHTAPHRLIQYTSYTLYQHEISSDQHTAPPDTIHDTRHSYSTRSLQISTPHRLTQYTTHVTPTARDLFRSQQTATYVCMHAS